MAVFSIIASARPRPARYARLKLSRLPALMRSIGPTNLMAPKGGTGIITDDQYPHWSHPSCQVPSSPLPQQLRTDAERRPQLSSFVAHFWENLAPPRRDSRFLHVESISHTVTVWVPWPHNQPPAGRPPWRDQSSAARRYTPSAACAPSVCFVMFRYVVYVSFSILRR